MAGKTILILGGGIGGLVAANRLRQYLPRQHRIVLLEKNAQHAFAPSFLWLMTGDRRPAQITRQVRQMVRSGVEVIHSEAHRIDLNKRYIETDSGHLSYDYLVLALGAELAPEAIPGLVEAGHTYYTLEGTIKLRDRLKTFTGGAVAVVVCALPYKCPGAPYEGAMLLADFFAKRGLREKVDLHLFTPEPQPMPAAGKALGEAIQQMLKASGAIFHPQQKLNAVDPQTRGLSFEGGEAFHYDLLIAIPPHRGAHLLHEAGLANEAGWVPVERATLATQYENVYALGDVTALPVPGRWKPDVPMMLSKAGVFAHTQAEVVAHRIADEINGSAASTVFGGYGYCMLESGGGKAGLAFGNFFGEPTPQIQLRQVGKRWHLGKVLFEKWWLTPPGLRREVLRLGLRLGSKVSGINIGL